MKMFLFFEQMAKQAQRSPIPPLDAILYDLKVATEASHGTRLGTSDVVVPRGFSYYVPNQLDTELETLGLRPTIGIYANALEKHLWPRASKAQILSLRLRMGSRFGQKRESTMGKGITLPGTAKGF